MKYTVGLTGGIATGKSTVARIFGELGVPVVDADQLAREVVAPGTPGLAQIVETFGAGVLEPSGALDRKALGAIVFADATQRKALEAITHPRIAQLTAQKIIELAAHPSPFVIYEAALLVENGSYRNFPALVVVTTSGETQLARVMSRDTLSREDAQARIDAQMPMAEKAALADLVIDNTGDLAALRARVTEVHAALLERVSQKRTSG